MTALRSWTRFAASAVPSITVVVGLVALLLAVLWFGQRSFIYFPDGETPSPGAFGLAGVDPETFDTEDELTLGAWFVPARVAGAGYTVIVFNGNAGHRGHRAGLAAQLAARGVNVFLFDYRGYGGNPGLPSEEGLARDARAALAALGRRPGVDLTRIVFLGESLGAAVAVRLALEFPPAALVLRSPFSSMTAIGSHHYPFLPVRWLLRDRYSSIDRISRITSPLLVIAGGADRIVPIFESEALFELAPQPKKLVVGPGADHNDEGLAEGVVTTSEIISFIHGR